MHHHLLYVASAEQINATKLALARLRAKELASDKSNSFATIFEVKHHVLGETILRVALLENIDHVVAHLRSQPVDILVYDERKGVEAIQALEKMKADIQGLADLWGPDFVFPFSRVVAILEKTRNQSHRAFELGRLRVRDVYVEPQQTAQVLRWIKDLLTHTIQRQNRIGVAMSGGGLEGFLFQMGCLFALELAVKGKSLSSAHVFSGVSSGSLAATILACKVPLVEVLRGVYRKSEVLPPLQSSVLFDFATKEIAMRAFSETLSWKGFDPTKWMTFLLKSLPTGFLKEKDCKNILNRF